MCRRSDVGRNEKIIFMASIGNPFCAGDIVSTLSSFSSFLCFCSSCVSLFFCLLCAGSKLKSKSHWNRLTNGIVTVGNRLCFALCHTVRFRYKRDLSVCFAEMADLHRTLDQDQALCRAKDADHDMVEVWKTIVRSFRGTIIDHGNGSVLVVNAGKKLTFFNLVFFGRPCTETQDLTQRLQFVSSYLKICTCPLAMAISDHDLPLGYEKVLDSCGWTVAG